MVLKLAPTNALLEPSIMAKRKREELGKQASEVLSVKEACTILGVHRNTLYKLIETEQIPAFQICNRGSWKIRREHLNDWIESKEARR